MPIYETARFKVRPESLARCEGAIKEFVEYIRANEPDTLLYSALQVASDPTSFLHYFIFANEAARDRHSISEGVRRFTDALYPETLEPVEFNEYVIVSSTP